MTSEESGAGEPEDIELVRLAQGGETTAFDSLVMKYSPKLYSLVYHMTANREDSADLLQDIFAKAYRSLKHFRANSAFYTWIYSIAVNMTLNFLKKRNRRATMSLDELHENFQGDPDLRELATHGDPTREAHLKELQIKLNESMMLLSEPHRTVVILHDIQGMPHTEISRILGVSEGTVRSRLFYAHRILQSHLAEFRS